MNHTRFALPALLLITGCEVAERLDSECSSLSGSRCGGVIAIDATDAQAPVFSIEEGAEVAPDHFTLSDPENDPCTYYLGRTVWEVDGLSEQDLPLHYGEVNQVSEELTEGRWYLAAFAAGDRIGDSTFNVAGWSAVFKPGEPDSVMRWDDLAEICEEPPPRTTW